MSFWCAGRDGRPAGCLLLYRFADVMRLAALGNQEYDWEVRIIDLGFQGCPVLSLCLLLLLLLLLALMCDEATKRC